MSGISAQKGFYFQKQVFIYNYLNISHNNSISYEVIDDVGIENDDSLYSKTLDKNSKIFIQAKSGTLSDSIFAKTLANWLLATSNYSTYEFHLELENDYIKKDESVYLNTIKAEAIAKRTAQKSSIYRQIFEKYKINSEDINVASLMNDFNALFSSLKIIPHSDIDTECLETYSRNFCGDIVNVKIAKKLRFKRLQEQLFNEIDIRIDNNGCLEFDYNYFSKINNIIVQNISDSVYYEEFSTFKSNKKAVELANELINDSKTEVRELRFVYGSNNEKIHSYLLKKIFYNNLRKYYDEADIMGLNDVEECAFAIYEKTRDELDINNVLNSQNLFFSTINKMNNSRLITFSIAAEIYSTGCYIYLTSDDAREELKIKWR